MVLSFVDRDMVMRYFGGGIGHLSNSTRHQVDAEPPDTEQEEPEEEMEISDDGGNNPSGLGEAPEDIIMDDEVENSDDEQGSGSDSSESDSGEDSDEGSGEDSNEDSNEGTIIDSEDSDDDGYGSF
jgi:hypothetical protein